MSSFVDILMWQDAEYVRSMFGVERSSFWNIVGVVGFFQSVFATFWGRSVSFQRACVPSQALRLKPRCSLWARWDFRVLLAL